MSLLLNVLGDSKLKRGLIFTFFFSFISLEYTTSLIIKRQIADAKRRELFRCDKAFENEIAAYSYLIPVLKKFSNDNLPYPQLLFAGKDSLGEIIAMEDLSQQGYKMANRIEGLDFEHCSLALKVSRRKISIHDVLMILFSFTGTG